MYIRTGYLLIKFIVLYVYICTYTYIRTCTLITTNYEMCTIKCVDTQLVIGIRMYYSLLP